MTHLTDIPGLSIILIDDHEVFCEGIKELFKKSIPKIHFYYFNNINSVKNEITKKVPHFLVCDLLIPNTDLKEFIHYCKQTYPQLLLVILSSVNDTTVIREYFHLGVHAFISKGVSFYEIKLALEKVYQGERYISNDLSSKLTSSFFSAEKSNLTNKELEILRLIAAGNTVIQTANLLHISSFTVMAHRRSIMKKLDLHSAAALVKYAFENKIV